MQEGGEATALSHDELASIAAKNKAKESDTIVVKPPQVGVISLNEWRYHVISVVAASSTLPSVATKWISAAFTADSPDQLEDPVEFESLSLKLSTAAYEVAPEDLKRELQLKRD